LSKQPNGIPFPDEELFGSRYDLTQRMEKNLTRIEDLEEEKKLLEKIIGRMRQRQKTFRIIFAVYTFVLVCIILERIF
jgi:hypothetical protein